MPSNFRDAQGNDPFSDNEGRNPFRDAEAAEDFSAAADAGPFAAPRSAADGYHPDDFETILPHRGVMILILGLSAVMLCAVLLCQPPLSILALGPALPAILLALSDLRAMHAGVMDSRGQTLTRAGLVLGVAAAAISLFGPAMLIALLFWIGF